jgi:hypothetical protein
MKDKNKFKRFMTGLGKLFDKTISRTLMDIYWKSLEPFSDEACEKAFNKLITASKFFPKPADFIEILNGTSEDRALNAWLIVENTVKTVGPYASVRFEDPVIHSVIDSLGGWPKFQDCTNRDWTWRQKEFMSRYKAMSHNTNHPQYLPGILETQNKVKNYPEFIDPPVIIRQVGSGRVMMIEPPKSKDQKVVSMKSIAN